ncbi:ATP-binding cassette domain-containing protein [Candidatus Pelagibacter sp.]|uniref:ATP-binding cassette domain-containing protein n=1 Tax=Candidatus Pelagibacter sp. TaxID=2024849 RepID=UPI003F84DA97|tara:strand:+ start:2721 stop:4457 length:1737 start_codon:yes stop_codon:yes gene_type:complete
MIRDSFKKISILTKEKEKFYLKFYFLFFIIISLFETIGVGLLPTYLSIILDEEILIDKVNSFNIDVPILNNLLLNENLVLIFGILIIVFFTIKFFLNLFFFILEAKLFNNLKINLSSSLFKIYLNKNYIFHTENNPIILGRNITSEVNITVGYIRSFILIIKELLQTSLIVILLLFINAKLTISIMFLFSLLAIFYLKFFSKKLKKKFDISFFERGEKSKIVNQILNAFIEVKLYKKSKFFTKEFKDSITREFGAIKYLDVLNKLPKIFIELLLVLIFFASILFIIKLNINLNIVIPYLALYFMAALRIYPSISNIILNRLALISGKISITQITKEFINLNKDVDTENEKYSNIFEFKDKIKFENVFYSFKGRKPILENINFEINKNDFIGIIGETGSGKSTLIKLMMGFIAPSKGKIIVDENNLEIIKNNFQSIIGYVPQNFYLIDDTILKNIIFGDYEDNINIDKINKILKEVSLEKFVNNLPSKLNTIVGSNGKQISGGQAQRLAIARALYQEPELIIFDEATNALDEKTELEIIENINKIKKDKTIILITHKPNLLENCNKIFQISNKEVLQIK